MEFYHLKLLRNIEAMVVCESFIGEDAEESGRSLF
jgi:hypothetical protein